MTPPEKALLPAGMSDVPSEATEITAARELVEEVGLAHGRLEHLDDMYSSPGMTDSVLTLYLATELTSVERSTHGPEEDHMEVLDVPLSEAVQMVLAGEIHDAKTIIGLLLAERALGQVRAARDDRRRASGRGRGVLVVDGERACSPPTGATSRCMAPGWLASNPHWHWMTRPSTTCRPILPSAMPRRGPHRPTGA